MRGRLLAIDPEEVRYAVMAAIARDIDAGVDEEVLKQWRKMVLSCTATFVIHNTELASMQASIQLREKDNRVSRTSLQRIYEVASFREAYARGYGRQTATSRNVAAAYPQMQMSTSKGRERISSSFVDIALTIYHRVLKSIPAAEKLLLEMASALSREDTRSRSTSCT